MCSPLLPLLPPFSAIIELNRSFNTEFRESSIKPVEALKIFSLGNNFFYGCNDTFFNRAMGCREEEGNACPS